MKKQALLLQMNDVDIRLLRIFCAVAEAGGVSAAELELNIGRSAISRHLKDLETRLEVVLCRRGRGGFALTDEGGTIYDAAQRLLASIDTFRLEVNEVHNKMTGNLPIALFDKTITNPDCRIYEAIRLFDEQAPAVTLEVHVGNINDIEKGVMDGRFSLGVIPTHRTSTSLNYTSLFPERVYLYAGRDHPVFSIPESELNDSMLRSSKFVGLGYHSPNMEISNQTNFERDASCYDQEAVATLILSGRYLGYLPDHYAQSFESQSLIRPILNNRFKYRCEFVAITRRAPKLNRITQAFLRCLEQTHFGN